MNDFPILDLAAFAGARGPDRAAMAAWVDQQCQSTGFLAVSRHGVSDEAIANIRAATRAFFDLPPEEKAKLAPKAGAPYGYLGPGTEALARSRAKDTPPDLKESFNGGPAQAPSGLRDAQALAFCYAATPWPDLPGFRAAWETYYAQMEQLARRIMGVFAVALELGEDYFAPFIGAPVSALRALNYPPSTRPPQPGQQRAGAHTDYGSLTILLPEPGSRGLEVRTPQGNWREVPPIPGAFIINIGDLMQRWTNGRWRSTLHRVVVPARAGGARRQSLAFFHQPDWEARISCLPGCEGTGVRETPVLSGPYLMERFRAATS